MSGRQVSHDVGVEEEGIAVEPALSFLIETHQKRGGVGLVEGYLTAERLTVMILGTNQEVATARVARERNPEDVFERIRLEEIGGSGGVIDGFGHLHLMPGLHLGQLDATVLPRTEPQSGNRVPIFRRCQPHGGWAG